MESHPETVVIVGHGPSLKGGRLGEKIDACDWVVRLKNCSGLLFAKRDYGTKTSAMCSSTEVTHHLPKVKAKEYWCYPKKGFYAEQVIWQLSRATEFAHIEVPLELCNFWNRFFREQLKGNHPCVSTGTAAAIIALDRFKPKTLYLAGFDNVINPKIEGYRSTVVTAFNGGGKHDTGHDWKAEHELLPYLAAFYKTQIKDLALTYKTEDFNAGSNNDVSQGPTDLRAEDDGRAGEALSGQDSGLPGGLAA